nr:MAG TPA: hypothetical protein [Caudoviricetes sp.]
MVGSRRRYHVFGFMAGKSLNCRIRRIGVMLFSWFFLEPVAIDFCGNVRRNGFMWYFRI